MMDPNYYNDQYDNAGQYSRQHEVMDDREYYESGDNPPYYSEGEASGDRASPRGADNDYYSQNPTTYSRPPVPREDSDYYSHSNPSTYREGEEYQSNPSGYASQGDEEYYSQSNYYNDGGTLAESHLDSSRIDRSRGDDNMTFNYDVDDDNDNDPHLPPIEERVVDRTEAGEFHGDTHDVKISITTRVYFYAICAAINSCNLGYDIGISAGAAKKVQTSMDLSGVQVQLFMQSLNLFAMVGALCSHFISDNWGRLRTFQFSSCIFIVGVIIVCTSKEFYGLIFGRLFVGLGVGFGLGIDPMYISEISRKFCIFLSKLFYLM